MKRKDREAIIAALAGEATREEFERLRREWSEDPGRKEAFQRLSSLWESLEGIDDESVGVPPPSAREVIARAAESRGTGPDSPGRLPRRARSQWFARRHLGLAASLIVGLGIGAGLATWTGGAGFGPDALVTGENEVATVTLEDNTVVRLGPGSRLAFPRDGGSREVSLQGRAYFAVAREMGDRFRVRVAEGSIEVEGTRFDVQSRDGALQVAVVEGTVGIAARGRHVTVAAGQVGRTGPAGGEPSVERVDDVFTVIDWLGRFLAFESTPLDRVVQEFERRFGIEIEVADEALRSRTVTGWFADQTPQEMVAGICRAVEALCTVDEGRLRMEASGSMIRRGSATLVGQ